MVVVVVVEKEQIRGAPPRAGIRGVVVVVWSEAREGPGRGRYELASAVAKLSWAPCSGVALLYVVECQGRAVLSDRVLRAVWRAAPGVNQTSPDPWPLFLRRGSGSS